VRGVSGRDAVGFPDIHLSAAGSVATNAGVLVVVGGLPAIDVALSRASVILIPRCSGANVH
jgi:hypothetical protein